MWFPRRREVRALSHSDFTASVVGGDAFAAADGGLSAAAAGGLGVGFRFFPMDFSGETPGLGLVAHRVLDEEGILDGDRFRLRK